MTAKDHDFDSVRWPLAIFIGSLTGMIASGASIAALIVSNGKKNLQLVFILFGFEALGEGLSFLIARLVSNLIYKRPNYKS